MPLGTRDILLVVRAKDEASGVIRGIGTAFMGVDDAARRSAASMLATGSALVSMGAGMTAAGVGLGIIAKNWVDSALQWRQQVGLTATQLDGVGASMEDLSKIGLRVAAEVPVPFDQIQTGLFDIFSSMDVGVADAEKILTAFSKGAVAGQTDLQSAGRATIAILNSFGLSADDINRVMDVQFQLVRKGVGTYEEFASTIGLSLPAAARAGQSIEDLSGMLAFLTRNGLSASRASTSAGRALEALAHPTVVKRLEDMGIAVRDSQGNFRRVSDIAADLGKSFEDLTDPEIANAMQELFRGAGGTIQARRFWDMAIRNYDELLQRTDEMDRAAGAMGEAYDIMFAQPQTQIDRFNNLMKVASVTLGEVLLPYVERILDVGSDFLMWFLDLNPEIHKWVALITAGAAALLVFLGALSGISGMILIFGATIKMLGGISGIIALGAPLLLFLAALAGAAYLIYDNWSEIEPWWNEMWPKIQETARQVWDWIQTKWAEIWPRVKEVAETVWNWIVTNWPAIWEQVKTTAQDIYDWLLNTFNTIWPKVRDAAQALIDWWQENWPQIRDTVVEIVDEIRERWDSFWEQLKNFADWFSNEMWPQIKEVWDSLEEHVIPIIQGIIDIVQALWDYFMVAWPAIYTVLKIWWDGMVNVVEFAVGVIVEIVDFMLTTIHGLIDILAGILTLDFGRAWDGAVMIVRGFHNMVIGILQAIWSLFRGWINTIKDLFSAGWGAVRSIVEGVWNGIVGFFQGLPGRIAGAFVALAGMVAAPFIAAFNGIKSAWNRTVGGFGFSIPSWVPGVGGKSFSIPSMARGGLAFAPMLALIGDAGIGNPEVVSPVQLMKQTMIDALKDFEGLGYRQPVEAGWTGPSILIEAGAVNVIVQGDGDVEKIREVVYDALEEVLAKVG